MPRYFFNTRIGDELISDPEGEELRNPDRAWEVARAMIRELLRTEGAEGAVDGGPRGHRRDGEIVLEFPFAEALLDFSDMRVTNTDSACHSGAMRSIEPGYPGSGPSDHPGRTSP